MLSAGGAIVQHRPKDVKRGDVHVWEIWAKTSSDKTVTFVHCLSYQHCVFKVNVDCWLFYQTNEITLFKMSFHDISPLYFLNYGSFFCQSQFPLTDVWDTVQILTQNISNVPTQLNSLTCHNWKGAGVTIDMNFINKGHHMLAHCHTL